MNMIMSCLVTRLVGVAQPNNFVVIAGYYIQEKNEAKYVSESYVLSFVYTSWHIFMLVFGRNRWFCICRARA